MSCMNNIIVYTYVTWACGGIEGVADVSLFTTVFRK